MNKLYFFLKLKLRSFYIKFAGDIFIWTLLEISTIKFAGDVILYTTILSKKPYPILFIRNCVKFMLSCFLSKITWCLCFFKFNLPSQSKYFLVQIKFAGDVLALTVQCTFKSLKQWLQNHSSCQKHHVFTEPYFPLPACTKRHTHTHTHTQLSTYKNSCNMPCVISVGGLCPSIQLENKAIIKLKCPLIISWKAAESTVH